MLQIKQALRFMNILAIGCDVLNNWDWISMIVLVWTLERQRELLP